LTLTSSSPLNLSGLSSDPLLSEGQTPGVLQPLARVGALAPLRQIEGVSRMSRKILGGRGFLEDASLARASASSLSHQRMWWSLMPWNLSSSF
jgi:hypothetical protein